MSFDLSGDRDGRHSGDMPVRGPFPNVYCTTISHRLNPFHTQGKLRALLDEAELYQQGTEQRTQSLEQIRSILLDRCVPDALLIFAFVAWFGSLNLAICKSLVLQARNLPISYFDEICKPGVQMLAARRLHAPRWQQPQP
jgi:hypothetical protein